MKYEIKVLVKLPENDRALWYDMVQEGDSPESAVVFLYERARRKNLKIINLANVKEL